jgi:hypothetical protein
MPGDWWFATRNYHSLVIELPCHPCRVAGFFAERAKIKTTPRLKCKSLESSVGEHESSKISTIPVEIRTTPYAISSLLTAVGGYSVNRPDTRSSDYCLPIGTISTQAGRSMEAIGLLVTLEARAGKETDGEAFLRSAQLCSTARHSPRQDASVARAPSARATAHTSPSKIPMATRGSSRRSPVARSQQSRDDDLCVRERSG